MFFNAFRFVALSLVVFIVSGCAITDSSHVLVGNKKTPVTPSQVKLYIDPPAKFEKIAIVQSEAAHDFANQQTLMDIAISNLKEEAASLGANGILLESAGQESDGAYGYMSPQSGFIVMESSSKTVARGIAVFVLKE